ncbi:DNA mismatch repair protein MutS [Acetobacter senegalensis]|uniref:DNA mismatch repair protein MutS n=1 Tax=Acetobacter senegalensis TaxID=446692 RepID=UPI0020A196E6|nr:DNA mismatch repair protein MutS [Acetobacter senegalensis]MCP1195239.1 DNA mismatch repair protein MutS [Acetobacter senegalensis]
MKRYSPEGATPAMAQWFALKAENPEALLFFRMGDFYELFFDDATAAAAALDIALTARGTHAGEPISMCGVPVAAAPAYLARLIRRGFRVAVAEQTEAPRKGKGAAKGPLARAVVRVVTPGTLTEDELLEPGRSNLLLALVEGPASTGRGRKGKGAEKAQKVQAETPLGAAWIDVSTGLFETASVTQASLAGLLGRLDPAEILAPADLALGDFDACRAPEVLVPGVEAARQRLASAFDVASVDAFGTFSDEEAMAAAVAVDYVQRSQAGKLPRLTHPTPQTDGGILGIDPATRASLDLLRARDGGMEHTLFSAVNQTVTAAGARLMAEWLSAPLTDVVRIAARQDGWCWLRDSTSCRTALRDALKKAPDVARALGRLSLGRGQPRDLSAIRDALHAARAAAAALGDVSRLPPYLSKAAASLGGAQELEAELVRALAEDLPARLDDGGVIAAGYDGELDGYRGLRDNSRRVVAGLQIEYASRYGVASLKIKHHAQLGYVIEVPVGASSRMKDRDDLMFRQGTASNARFSTEELAGLDARIAEAAERAAAREKAVFNALVDAVLAEQTLPVLAKALAVLDVQQSCAMLAAGGSWCRPDVTDDTAFDLQACRHPVVESALPKGTRFTPNGCDLSPNRRVMLLTGPNMAGKSTFLRQTALAVILAQGGFPVAAEKATIGVVDQLFSRVGASDDLARGRSTFMVEMTETAAILNQAGPRSLVVVDEIGRGTATLDGLAIAWSVLEALHSTVRCRAIFATHFHELADLVDTLPRLAPHTMAVREWRGQIVFLHEVLVGSAKKSWGVHVARLAGVPASVVDRAGRLLKELEREHATGPKPLPLFDTQKILPHEEENTLRKRLSEVDPDTLTPRAALDILYELHKQAVQEEGSPVQG